MDKTIDADSNNTGMTREEEILFLLENEPEDDIFEAYTLLEEAKDLVRHEYSVERQEAYDHALTQLNCAIFAATGLTDPSDLAIARRFIRDSHIWREYQAHTAGAEFSDSD